LRLACARNTSAEVHAEDPLAGMVSSRARLLNLDEQHVYLDQPQSIGQPVALTTGQVVTVYFLMNGTRHAFRSHVVRPRCYVRLNARQQVPGISVTMPARVGQQQRRADFRISLASYQGSHALIHAGSAEGGGSAPVDALRWTARMVNVSAGGLGVLAQKGPRPHWKIGGLFFLTFRLPEYDYDFVIMAELKHVRRIHGGHSTIAGFRFLPWHLGPVKSHARQITRFIAMAQRRQLRRGR
jgi:c-di-GMP-binding flagellar brake protein YcgR